MVQVGRKRAQNKGDQPPLLSKRKFAEVAKIKPTAKLVI
jgi:hypothetical protein